MTDRRFEHEESILARCAKSCVASFIESGQSYVYNGSSKETFLQKRAEENGEPSQVGCAENDESCALLFRLHAQHYGRIHANEDTILARTILNGSFEPPPPLNANPLVYTYKVGSKMEAFIRNIIFVHHHNSAAGNMHRVTLNRFSDLRPSEVLVERRVVDPASMWSEKARRLTEVVNTNADEDLVRSGRVPLFGSAMEGMAVLLSTSEEILQVAANFTIGHGSKNQLHYKSKKKSKKAKVTYDLYPKSIQLPPDAYLHSSEDGRFETPALDPRMDGSLLSIQRNKDYHSERHHYHTRRDDDDSMISDNRNVHLDAGAIDDDFATYLNWATTDNPDGVSVVHDAYDQGTCGSCWASSAAGSLEASAARREAYNAYRGYSKVQLPLGSQGINKQKKRVSVHQDAVLYAQAVERRSFQMLNLSIQELLDCDTNVDQGCTGGNPLIAFHFIHSHGLTSWERYPYVGYETTCKHQLIKYPVASVKSWGVLPPNHEDNMELALRYIGPISVGFNGAHPTFLSYDGGVFSKLRCKQGSNHALLLVGYGEEDDVAIYGNKTLTRFWIARNSWGRGWGENGFVRIRRGDGRKGTPGECGIARSPSVALGGILLQYTMASAISGLHGGVVGDNSTVIALEQMDQYSKLVKLCLRFGRQLDGRCGRVSDWLDEHRAGVLGMAGIFAALLVLWPLTLDYRKRSRRRRLKGLHCLDNASRRESHAMGETLPLVGNDKSVCYGTSDKS